MSIVRVNKRQFYKSISNVPLNDSRLTLEARGLLVHLLAQFDGWAVNIKALEKRAKRSSEGRLYNLFKELMEHGYCRRIDYKNSKGQADGNEYQIYEEPVDDGLPPVITLPSSEKPDAVLPGQEYPHHNKYEVLTNTKLNKNEVNASSSVVAYADKIGVTDWQSSSEMMESLSYYVPDIDFVDQQLDEFRGHWRDKGYARTAEEWDRVFKERCLEQWARRQRRIGAGAAV